MRQSTRAEALVPFLRALVAGLGALAVGSAVWAVGWLGPRGWVIVAAVALGVILVWWPGGRAAAARVQLAIGAALTVGVGTVVAGTALRRSVARGRSDRVADRIAVRDLPPVGGYAAVATGLLIVGVCVLLAWQGRGALGSSSRGRGRGRRWSWSPSVLGLAVSLAAVPVIVGAGSVARHTADRWSDSGQVWSTRSRPAVRLDQASGPVLPAHEDWEAILSSPDPALDVTELLGAADVPGWDVVMAAVEEAAPDPESLVARQPDLETVRTRIVAISKTDGTELWSHARPGWFDGVAVDPDAGRVLVVYHDAVEVLDLHDGAEVGDRSLPEVDEGGPGWRLVADPGGNEVLDAAVPVVVGTRAAILGAPDTVDDGDDPSMLGLVDVATGRLVSSIEVPACEYSANASGPFPVVLQWSSGGGRCEDHTVFGPDAAGRLRPIATIHPPETLRGDEGDDVSVEGCDLFCTSNRILVTRDAIVLTPVWSSDDPITDLVVLSPDGEVRWRATEVTGRGEPIGAPIGLLTVDDDHIVAGWAEQ
jgi:hypothetical protein